MFILRTPVLVAARFVASLVCRVFGPAIAIVLNLGRVLRSGRNGKLSEEHDYIYILYT